MAAGNSTLTNIKGQQAKNPDLTITVNRTDLESLMGGKATFDDLIAVGKVNRHGDGRHCREAYPKPVPSSPGAPRSGSAANTSCAS